MEKLKAITWKGGPILGDPPKEIYVTRSNKEATWIFVGNFADYLNDFILSKYIRLPFPETYKKPTSSFKYCS